MNTQRSPSHVRKGIECAQLDFRTGVFHGVPLDRTSDIIAAVRELTDADDDFIAGYELEVRRQYTIKD